MSTSTYIQPTGNGYKSNVQYQYSTNPAPSQISAKSHITFGNPSYTTTSTYIPRQSSPHKITGRAISPYRASPNRIVASQSTYAQPNQVRASGYNNPYSKLSNYTTVPDFSNATNEIANLIKKLEIERKERAHLEKIKHEHERVISDLKNENIDKFNAIQELSSVN